jgi:hypothetical protein
MTRELIYSALFDKVKSINGIKTSSRILEHYNDVSPRDQPALYQTQISETPTQMRGMPVKWNLKINLHLYINRGGDHRIIPSQEINRYIDLIEVALKPDIDGFQTLSGLVSHCWISGTIMTSEGLLGDQEVAIIPIEIYLSNQL